VTRLLLDTHLVLWWLNDDPRLPAAAVERLLRLLRLTVDCQLRRYGATVFVLEQ
jgi:hypothetical protein